MSGLLRRLGAQGFRGLKNTQLRGGGAADWPHGKFWSEGTQEGHNGFLFGELPLKPGEVRQRQWWEPIWYTGYGLFFAGVYLIYNTKPLESLDIKYWARPRAENELKVEMRMLDKLNERPDLADRLKAVAEQLNLVEEEAYDLVLMRNEYKTLMGLHTGRVPGELTQIFEELKA
ncbi:NADH:ubiquinone oxidoreductase 17 kDa subunit [Dunaliella salina]|uniref:NADH:ubiquinone oxidoreductase 17 kDa subunit n=1 Tax=Dunaliella salina TaxID=3046 RepID=A0ABQ7GUJ0_DUNSA|nr:NADH:ubiquinone oxidoreductase 17 kDa subunit [Dunaliella salina]|eukprot:KAF5838285.1 NADH:ubiquinone oxidoreductase 17 kDa subunit [Dunaliella salina]